MVAGATEAQADTIIQWNFSTVEAAPYNSPAPDVGTGVATVLGMDNNYIFSSGNTIKGSGTFNYTTLYSIGSVAYADITAPPGDPNSFANAWRIRGPSNSPGAPQGNGWALQAPQYTQGAQFSSSTAGYYNVSFHFDWYTTTQGVKNLQEQYTLNGTTWININSPLTAVSDGWLAPQTINFSGIAGASNDPNFGVRLVSVYDNSLSFPNYGRADGGQGGYYNGSSGVPGGWYWVVRRKLLFSNDLWRKAGHSVYRTQVTEIKRLTMNLREQPPGTPEEPWEMPPRRKRWQEPKNDFLASMHPTLA